MSSHLPKLAACALLMSIAGATMAGKPTNVTDAEMALLPSYCYDVWGFKYGDAYTNTSPNAPKWVGLMGKGFWSMHHYCWALINLGRVQRPSTSPQLRAATREYAIDDMQYVIDNTTPDFVMLPEIYTKMGTVLLDLKRIPEARDALAKARSLKPDYWPPYFHWAEYLRQAGKKSDAREVVEEGLSYSPNAQPLLGLLKDLGGDPANIRPRPVAVPAKDPIAATESAKPAN